jgi:hypothetical protein
VRSKVLDDTIENERWADLLLAGQAFEKLKTQDFKDNKERSCKDHLFMEREKEVV